MTDYISREYVLKCMEDSFKNAGISAEAKAKMTRWLNKAPAADVAPVRRGKWISDKGELSCSVCGGTMVRLSFNYCPWCGSHMNTTE